MRETSRSAPPRLRPRRAGAEPRRAPPPPSPSAVLPDPKRPRPGLRRFVVAPGPPGPARPRARGAGPGGPPYGLENALPGSPAGAEGRHEGAVLAAQHEQVGVGLVEAVAELGQQGDPFAHRRPPWASSAQMGRYEHRRGAGFCLTIVATLLHRWAGLLKEPSGAETGMYPPGGPVLESSRRNSGNPLGAKFAEVLPPGQQLVRLGDTRGAAVP
jgi:hypothetical protein